MCSAEVILLHRCVDGLGERQPVRIDVSSQDCPSAPFELAVGGAVAGEEGSPLLLSDEKRVGRGESCGGNSRDVAYRAARRRANATFEVEPCGDRVVGDDSWGTGGRQR